MLVPQLLFTVALWLQNICAPDTAKSVSYACLIDLHSHVE
jgi:hypothetical protein